MRIFGTATAESETEGVYPNGTQTEELEAAAPDVRELWTMRVYEAYPSTTRVAEATEKAIQFAMQTFPDKMVLPPNPVLQAADRDHDERHIGLVEFSHLMLSDEDSNDGAWSSATAQVWRVASHVDDCQLLVPVDTAANVTELINFVLLAMSEFISAHDELPEDATTLAGILLDTRRQRKLNAQYLAATPNLVGFSSSLDTVQQAVCEFLAEGGPKYSKYPNLRVPLDETAFASGVLRSYPALGHHLFLPSSRIKTVVDVVLEGELHERSFERGKEGYALLESATGPGVILAVKPDKRDLQGLIGIKAAVTIPLTLETAVNAAFDERSDKTAKNGPLPFRFQGRDLSVGWAPSVEIARLRMGAEPAGLKRGGLGAAAAAQIGEITAKMGEMGDMLKATAEANAALQEQVVALSDATLKGRTADQQAHAEQQELQKESSQQIHALAASLNGFIEYSKQVWQARLEEGPSASASPTVRLIGPKESAGGKKKKRAWCAVERLLASLSVPHAARTALRAAAAIIHIMHSCAYYTTELATLCVGQWLSTDGAVACPQSSATAARRLGRIREGSGGVPEPVPRLPPPRPLPKLRDRRRAGQISAGSCQEPGAAGWGKARHAGSAPHARESGLQDSLSANRPWDGRTRLRRDRPIYRTVGRASAPPCVRDAGESVTLGQHDISAATLSDTLTGAGRERLHAAGSCYCGCLVKHIGCYGNLFEPRATCMQLLSSGLRVIACKVGRNSAWWSAARWRWLSVVCTRAVLSNGTQKARSRWSSAAAAGAQGALFALALSRRTEAGAAAGCRAQWREMELPRPARYQARCANGHPAGQLACEGLGGASVSCSAVAGAPCSGQQPATARLADGRSKVWRRPAQGCKGHPAEMVGAREAGPGHAAAVARQQRQRAGSGGTGAASQGSCMVGQTPETVPLQERAVGVPGGSRARAGGCGPVAMAPVRYAPSGAGGEEERASRPNRGARRGVCAHSARAPSVAAQRRVTTVTRGYRAGFPISRGGAEVQPAWCSVGSGGGAGWLGLHNATAYCNGAAETNPGPGLGDGVSRGGGAYLLGGIDMPTAYCSRRWQWHCRHARSDVSAAVGDANGCAGRRPAPDSQRAGGGFTCLRAGADGAGGGLRRCPRVGFGDCEPDTARWRRVPVRRVMLRTWCIWWSSLGRDAGFPELHGRCRGGGYRINCSRSGVGSDRWEGFRAGARRSSQDAARAIKLAPAGRRPALQRLVTCGHTQKAGLHGTERRFRARTRGLAGSGGDSLLFTGCGHRVRDIRERRGRGYAFVVVAPPADRATAHGVRLGQTANLPTQNVPETGGARPHVHRGVPETVSSDLQVVLVATAGVATAANIAIASTDSTASVTTTTATIAAAADASTAATAKAEPFVTAAVIGTIAVVTAAAVPAAITATVVAAAIATAVDTVTTITAAGITAAGTAITTAAVNAVAAAVTAVATTRIFATDSSIVTATATILAIAATTSAAVTTTAAAAKAAFFATAAVTGNITATIVAAASAAVVDTAVAAAGVPAAGTAVVIAVASATAAGAFTATAAVDTAAAAVVAAVTTSISAPDTTAATGTSIIITTATAEAAAAITIAAVAKAAPSGTTIAITSATADAVAAVFATVATTAATAATITGASTGTTTIAASATVAGADIATAATDTAAACVIVADTLHTGAPGTAAAAAAKLASLGIAIAIAAATAAAAAAASADTAATVTFAATAAVAGIATAAIAISVITAAITSAIAAATTSIAGTATVHTALSTTATGTTSATATFTPGAAPAPSPPLAKGNRGRMVRGEPPGRKPAALSPLLRPVGLRTHGGHVLRWHHADSPRSTRGALYCLPPLQVRGEPPDWKPGALSPLLRPVGLKTHRGHVLRWHLPRTHSPDTATHRPPSCLAPHSIARAHSSLPSSAAPLPKSSLVATAASAPALFATAFVTAALTAAAPTATARTAFASAASSIIAAAAAALTPASIDTVSITSALTDTALTTTVSTVFALAASSTLAVASAAHTPAHTAAALTTSTSTDTALTTPALTGTALAATANTAFALAGPATAAATTAVATPALVALQPAPGGTVPNQPSPEAHGMSWSPRRLPPPSSATRMFWFMTARAWNALMHALHGNTAALAKRYCARVWYWNARRLAAHAARRQTAGKMVASTAKLEWLDARLQEAQPDAICLQEVVGGLRQLRDLRGWFRRRGYDAVGFPGTGRATADDDGGADSTANGTVWAVRRQFGRIERSELVANRTVAVSIRVAASTPGCITLVGLHGLHSETRAEHEREDEGAPELSFRRQLRGGIECLQESGGGLLMGDMNHVPCRCMRPWGVAMDVGDRALQSAVGGCCVCCAVEEGTAAAGKLVVARDVDGGAAGTRRWRGQSEAGPAWRGSEGRWLEATLDMGVAIGASQAWKVEELLWPQVGQGAGSGVDLSDHALVSFLGQWVSTTVGRTQREVGLRIPIRPKGRKQRRLAAAYSQELSERLEIARLQAGAARAGQYSATHIVTGITRAAAQAAVDGQQAKEADRWWRGPPRRGSVLQQYNLCTRRLQALLKLRRANVDVRELRGGVLFHRCKELCRMRDAPGATASAAIDSMVRCCRRRVRRLGAIRRRTEAVYGSDRRLVGRARQIEAAGGDERTRAMKVMALVKESGGGGGVAMTEVFEGDTLEGRRVACTDPDFGEVHGRIGEEFVSGLDDGCNVDAYEAWCRQHGVLFTELEGITGGDWVLAKELTFHLFRRALFSMQRRKAVGAGGLTIELLLAGGREIQHLLYRAVRDDAVRLLEGDETAVAPNWRRVLYVLLKKKPPDDPRLVGQRREIALMPQDLKLFLQMLKLSVYRRVASRICDAQLGWSPGYGCTDACMTLQAVVQQARRLGHDVYILYLDLAQFFPRVQRRLATVGEMLQGLPADVARLALLIYGGYRGDSRATQCQFDSAAGLSAPFSNWMGWLMGCVLSPDKSRLLLNSIAIAIRAKAKGVRLWGFDDPRGPSSDQAAVAWRAIEQLLFGDDWCGIFSSALEVVKAWEMWRAWEAVTGTKIGVKALRKTVLTGVGWRDGKPVPLYNPQLRLRGGGSVPMLPLDEAYCYLGRVTRADAEDSAAWQSLRRKFKMMDGRLARIKPKAVSQKEFNMLADLLYGGLAGFFLQVQYISFEQAEMIERGYRRLFKRRFGLCESTPSATFYAIAGDSATGQRGRTHVWNVGLAALHGGVERAMADVHDTPQRAATRSMVALALERAGCCGDPAWWDADHLGDALEAKLRGSECRYLGDAWLLADILIARASRPAECEEDAFSDAKAAAAGRWETAEDWQPGDALHHAAKHFEAPRTPLLFEPAERGGIGLRPECILLEAGVKSLGMLCAPAQRESGDGGVWFASFAAFQAKHKRVPRSRKAEGAWRRTMELLEAEGIPPCTPEESRAREYGYSYGLEAAAAQARTGQARAAVGGVVDVEALRACTAAALERDECNGESPDGSGVGEWERRWQLPFGPKTAPAQGGGTSEWHTGSWDAGRDARLAHIVREIRGDGTVEREGGEASGWGDEQWEEGCEGLGEDGYARGWEQRAQQYEGLFYFDVEGYAIDPESGARLAENQVAWLPPLLQLEVRARLALGDVPVYFDTMGAKMQDTHICLEQQRRSHRRFCIWQARLEPTVAYTLDASQITARGPEGTVLRDDHGRPLKAVGRAAVRHDGHVVAGRLSDTVRLNNYTGELVAHIDAGVDAVHNFNPTVRRRAAYVFDATSPVSAEAKFHRAHDRRKQGYYCDEYLDTWRQVMEQHDVVLQLWQTSHVGDPTNEWADVEAGAAAKAEAIRRVNLRTPRHFSMRPSRPLRSWLAFGRARLGRAVLERLRANVCDSIMFEEGDIVIGELPVAETSALHGTLTNRCFLADGKRRRHPAAWRFLTEQGCQLCGTSEAVGTWSHYAFFCQCPALASAREEWVTIARDSREAIDPQGINQQLRTAMLMLTGDSALDHMRGEHDLKVGAADTETERRLRGFVGGVVDGYGETGAATRAAARKVVAAGARVLVLARQGERSLAGQLRTVVRNAQLLGRVVRGWRWHAVRGGPGRMAALRELSAARQEVCDMVREDAELTDSDRERILACPGGPLAKQCKVERERIEAELPWRGAAAILDWSVVRMVRAARLKWLSRIEASGRRVRGRHPLVARDLLLAAFGRLWKVTPPPVAVFTDKHGDKWQGYGADARAYAALCRWRELGGGRAWLAARRSMIAEARGEQAACEQRARRAAWRRWGGVVADEEWIEVGEAGEVEAGGRRLEAGEFADRFRRCGPGESVAISERARRMLGWERVRRCDFVCVDGRYFQPACGAQTLSGEALAERRPGLSGRVYGPGESETFTVEGGGRRQQWRSVRRRAAALLGRVALPSGEWVVQRVCKVFRRKQGGVLVLVMWANGADDWVRLVDCSQATRKEAKALLPVRQKRCRAEAAADAGDGGLRGGRGVGGGGARSWSGLLRERRGERRAAGLWDDLSQSEEEDEEEVASEANDAQAAGGWRGLRSTARAGGTARGAPELRMVPRATWPDEPCDELRGEGWLVQVVRTAGKANSAKVLCRFVTARTEEGLPYADEWLSGAALVAVPEWALAEERRRDTATAGVEAQASAAGLTGAEAEVGTREETELDAAMECDAAAGTELAETVAGRAELTEQADGGPAEEAAIFDLFEDEEDMEALPEEGGREAQSDATAQAQGHVHHEVLLRNSRVYAAKAEGAMNGLFALVPCRRGDVLVAYTGRLLTQEEARTSDSEYLLEADKVAQRRPWSRRMHRTVIDGQGELGGYANYACAMQANAVVLDVLHSLVKAGRKPKTDTMVLLVAACEIEAGQEVRFDYDGASKGFREAMISRGIGAEALDSGRYRMARWRVTAWAMMRDQRNVCADCVIRKLADVPGLDAERQLAGRGGGFEAVERG